MVGAGSAAVEVTYQFSFRTAVWPRVGRLLVLG